MYALWTLVKSPPSAGLQTLFVLKKEDQVGTAETSSQNRRKKWQDVSRWTSRRDRRKTSHHHMGGKKKRIYLPLIARPEELGGWAGERQLWKPLH